VGVYSSTMTVEELVDDAPGRLVLLSGAGLPVMGAAWGGKGNVITTWNPGNGRDGTQQTLGPQEIPSQWSGEWHRTTLPDSGCVFFDENGNSSKVNTPFFLSQTLEDIFRSGHLLRVTWSVNNTDVGESINLIRVGRASQWNFAFDRAQDIHWEITFDWKGRGDASENISTRDDSIVAAGNEVSAALAQALLKAKALNLSSSSANSLSLGQLDALAGYPNALVKGITRSLQTVIDQFAQVGDIVSKLKSVPFAISNTVVDFAHNNVAVAKQFMDNMGRTPIELMTLKSNTSAVAHAGKLFFDTNDSVELAARLSAELERKFRLAAMQARQMRDLGAHERSSNDENDIIGVYVTKEGDTPEKVSMRYYKNPDHGIDILRSNKLPYHQPKFRPGMPLIIPRLNTSQTPG
jgi:hypothetical protein